MRGNKAVFIALAFLMSVGLSGAAFAASAHDFNFTSIEGDPLPFAAFKGKPVLVVNTASHCGYTYQYKGLEELWQAYKARGLVILGVPSNDFGGQEPGKETEIKKFCEVNYGIDFPMTEKLVVRGDKAHPIYRWLAAELGSDKTPRWNFHKYLIDPNGKAIAAWPSRVEPTSAEIRTVLEPYLPN